MVRISLAFAFAALAAMSGGVATAPAQTRPSLSVRFLAWADVATLPGIEHHPALVGVPASDRPAAWDAWVRRAAAELRTRVQRGEEDSLAYLLVFGTRYTNAPRVTREFLERARGEAALQRAFDARIGDFLNALAAPQRAGPSIEDERWSWAAATMARLGYRVDSPAARARAAAYLLRNLSRVLKESRALSETLDRASRAGDAGTARAERARVFAQRGLASDTSWPINFALSRTLAALRDAGALQPASVRQVALVGPGLDFVDKDEGHDYYPPQSLQPFAVLDAILAGGLSAVSGPRVVAIDINPRVVGHLERLASPQGRRPFDLQLVRDPRVAWTPDAARYWAGFGGAIGEPAPPVQAPPTAGPVETRAIRVAEDVLKRVAPLTADVVYQRIELASGEAFDLAIATNVLLYYDTVGQLLAATNLAALLAPGGLLLTNTNLDDVAGLPFSRVLSLATPFSDRAGDGEFIHVYRKGR